MLPSLPDFRRRVGDVLGNKKDQGYEVAGLDQELMALPDSYDALWAFALRLSDLPIRPDYPYLEPSEYSEIEAQMAADRPRGYFRSIGARAAAERVKTAFVSSICGCMVGKPLEVNPTLDELKVAFEALGEWPISDYVSEKLSLRNNRSFHHSWVETCRERLVCGAADDDINYTVLGMVILEQHGIEFTRDQLRSLWLTNIPPYFSWGPERTYIVTAALRSFYDDWKPHDEAFHQDIVTTLNPGDEYCGAMIRADAYGYACPGNPELAAKLAWRDASLTHRKTGIYGSMFAAAAMAVAPVAKSPLEIFEIALKFIPQKSRFHHIVGDSMEEVSRAEDFFDGYYRIHGKYKEYAHCRVYQESGTLVNSLRFAENIGHGFCLQVMQGNDTDSYGATSGSILGLFFGPGHLEERWTRPLNDTLQTTLACFHEQRLSAVSERMSKLPELVRKATGA